MELLHCLTAKTAPKKIGALIAWNIVAKHGLLLVAVTWNCQISYKNGYVELLVFYLACR